MATIKQKLGEHGETLVCQLCICPKCKRAKTFRRLKVNFECADIICEFCSFTAQVKATRKTDLDKLPRKVPGAAWIPQKLRLEAGIYIPFYLVLVRPRNWNVYAIYYLVPDVQHIDMFLPRKKRLSPKAKRAGWWGFDYKFHGDDQKLFVRLK